VDTEEANLIVGLLQLVLAALALIPRESRNRTKDDEEALAALSDAYHSTNKYYEFLDANKGRRDRSQEADLARKWEQVGILLKKYDETLADRLDAKSRYWKAGGTWSNEVIKQAGIGLENIRREVRLRVEHRK
jgi:hypothetical protein